MKLHSCEAIEVGVESLRDREKKGEIGVKNTEQRGLQLTKLPNVS